ncbi:RlmE family RNA methyltransferase [Neorickettsia sennetsu]|uniref:Ribosomal RNA large subunit methyltransferase E n=1 Tax=Ehrlichia sennetsu (strain ATCC VR-367 / Miyayama) TaxID=222891 RepID=RLME_EHRS3|nr:RlmE family RNA methyltransferase [Neorickettsia sennetsu]Q2GDL7.1 RecName: Full=Ribosomal RNA large subunit methyltransferase E; AltName: Full=23S rRNA Um2552 methyltransferase; AltName: Full=rRNA (uridine-2'-O-)-methyltransferase [Neorickettsia sennetsu str. Miyayama]ABD46360.1 ribosomal RNA large subunit methyltransferase J [Neorickettsia sennetsu str. Miyayama]
MKNKLHRVGRCTASSSRWLYRHVNDPFVKKAKAEQYRSRAAYKLLEIDEKFNLIRKGFVVLELGSAPGGWSQVIADILNGTGRLIAVDLADMDPISGVEVVKLDIELQRKELYEYISGVELDVIVSDLAPSASGSRVTDSISSIRLAELVLHYAKNSLKKFGTVVTKILRGSEDEYRFVNSLRKQFKKIEYFKPDASRKASREIYLILLGKLS